MSRVRAVCLPIVAAAVVCLLSAGSARAQVGHPLYECADQLLRHVREYVENVTHDLADCEVNKRLAGIGSGDCVNDPSVLSKLANLNQELELKIRESGPEGAPANDTCWGLVEGVDDRDEGRALCPLESRTIDVFLSRVMGGTCVEETEEGLPPMTCTNDGTRGCTTDADCLPGTLRGRAIALVADLFRTPYPGCTRPAGSVAKGVRDCATELSDLAEEKGGQANQCFFSCEKANLGSSDACVDEDDGEPAAADVIDCVVGKTAPDQDLESIVNECNDAQVAILGCPLGADTPEDLAAALGERLATQAQEINLSFFHSSCRTQLPGVVVPVVPAEVTLLPSGRKAQVSCGQVLDDAFFGSDRQMNFDTDLNCVNVDEATNGIVIARNGVTVSGRAQARSISGPGRRSLRTGAGVAIAPGVRRTVVSGFRRIQNFAVGVDAPADAQGVKVLRSTFFRNIDAGVRSSAKRTRIGELTLDRNGVGLDLSGDGSLVTKTFVRRSEPQSKDAQTPLSSGFGIVLGGTDADGNGKTVRITQTSVEENVLGILVDGDHHVIESNNSSSRGIRSSLGFDSPPRDGILDVPGDGILVLGSSNRIHSTSIKRNAGNGITVLGDNNALEAISTEENVGYGFEVGGVGNSLKNNDAGAENNDPTKPGLGNLLAGYLISGTGGSFESNRAESNHGDGFVLEGATALFKGNRSKGNAGIGFDILSTGNTVNSNQAEENSGSEYAIEAGNSDPQSNSNKANGSSFTFPAGGGTIE